MVEVTASEIEKNGIESLLLMAERERVQISLSDDKEPFVLVPMGELEELERKLASESYSIPVENRTDGKRVAAILQEIADSGDIEIDDPKEWQREMREDRPLPFRDA